MPAQESPISRHQRRIAFIVSEDWFFASHFLPMVRAARQAGFEPLVITRVGNHRGIVEEAGARVIALNVERRNFNVVPMTAAAFRIAAILRREKVDAVHCIALRSIVLGALAANLAGVRPRVLAVTGGGLLTAGRGRLPRLSVFAIRATINTVLKSRQTHFLFENATDPLSYGLQSASGRMTILGGAGIDPGHYQPLPQPAGPELTIAMVSRMLWSKGADIAIDAVELARAKGHDVRLSLYGAPDSSNPRTISPDVLKDWSSREGIYWHGPITDVRQVWATHQLACLPSRGGEGLPRTILEAAACGRAILTTDVPGCRDFVRDGQEGWLVPVDDRQALADRICTLSADRSEVLTAGRNARERVLDGFTETHVVERVSEVYRALVPPHDGQQA